MTGANESTAETRSERGEWEELGRIDPLWAILSDPEKHDGQWDLDDFMASGRREATALMERATALGYPSQRTAALDFGCGVGRVTQALATYFDRCVGVDVAVSMVERATELARDAANCSFVVNTADDLRMFGNGTFNFVYSSLVLQHVGSSAHARRYIAEFVRVLRPGGLGVFQVPSHIPLRYRLQPRRRLYRWLRRTGLPATFLQRRLRLYPISMLAIAETEVTGLLNAHGAMLISADASVDKAFAIESRTYWFTLR